MFRRLLGAGLAITAAGFMTVAHAQTSADKWVLVGKGEIDVTKPTGTIDLSKAKGAYKAVRLVSRRGEIEIVNVEIRYAAGGATNERRNIKLKGADRTRVIELKGDTFLEDVNLSLASKPAGARKSQLEVFALQSPAGAKMARPTSGGALAGGSTPPQPGSAATGSAAGGGGDVMFGFQRVGFGVDRDVIKVGAEVGKFDRIRLRILENDIHLNELKVIYFSGDPDVLAVNADLKQNTRTVWLPVKGDRFIREIQMSYRSRPNFRGQARVEVYGDYAANWLGPQGEGRKYNQGWVLLGSKVAGFVGFDNEAIQVGRNEGGFKRIRVNVKERAITLNELRIVYLTGSEDVVAPKSRVDADKSYGPIDVKGSRAIKEIKAKYRSRFFDKDAVGKGAAIVEVWGQH